MVTRAQIAWKLSADVVAFVGPIRVKLGEEAYHQDKRSLQDFLSAYFSANGGCTREQGGSISPLGCPTKPGWKCLKVRWAPPGTGKSGGVRLAVAVHCTDRRVNVVGAWMRRDAPNDAEFAAALEDPEQA
jgi:hypothetical protein